jgi:tol-pal system protein YbgF
MKCLKTIIFAGIVPIFFGCATVEEKEPLPVKEELHIVEIKKSIAETNIRIDELNNKFLLLQEKVVTNTEKIEKLNAQIATVEPPENLKVIRLKEKEVKKESATETPDPEGLYSHGQDLFINGEYEKARKVFSNLVEMFPGHNLADNALYWMGESHYAARDYEQALAKFKELVDRYPEENKAPDAMLKLGYTYIELEAMERGTNVLKRLIRDYPGSAAADKARKRLEKIPK